ncbi:MAG: protein phosphatase 2C domain-containing protein [Gammaproteobacteria bacterium]|nr:protein phosphatase 2C domain-containing protein [Gammaproteobacteria bacterium]
MHQYGAGTHVGNIRDNNEDSYVCDEEKGLWIVADGMGGLGFGEVASAISTYTVAKMIGEGHGCNQAIESAHSQIKAYAESDGMGTNMGTTIVLLLSHGSLYNIFWVGDSRAYLLDNGEFKQVTVDHSLVQSLIDQGEITAEEAETDPRKNAVTRALGVQELETVRADSISDKWKPGQKILLCSDGLTDCVSNSGIQAILQEEGTDQELADRLIQAALEGGGKDNVTVIVVSAAPGTKYADSDTHVPGSVKNDADRPLTDDTQRRKAKKKSRTKQGSVKQANVTQLELRIPETTKRIATLREPLQQETSPVLGFRHEVKVIMAVAASVVLAIFVTVANVDSGEKPEKPEEFNQQEEISGLTRREFPAIDLPVIGPIIQVGVFTKLEGAEEKQIALSQLGLESYVHKRSTENGLLYAVLLGPLSAEIHRSTVATLTANNLSYFHRPTRGS